MTTNFYRVESGLDFPGLASAPLNPSEGAVYYDTVMIKLRQYRNGAWQDLDSGDTTSVLETIKNTALDLPYNFITPSVAKIQEDDLVTFSGTAFLDRGISAYNLLNTGDAITSINLLDPEEFLVDDRDIWDANLLTFWKIGYIDTAATYQISRDGGNHWYAMTMNRIGNNTPVYQGEYTWLREEESAVNTENTTYSTTTELSNAAGTTESLGAKFSFTNRTRGNILNATLSKVGSPTGNFRYAIYSDSSGVPGSLLFATAWTDIATTITGSAVSIPINFVQDLFFEVGSTYYLVVETDSTYKGIYVASTTSIQWHRDVAGTNLAFSLDGATWSAIASAQFAFRVDGYEESFASLLDYTTVNNLTTINATTEQRLSQAFTVTSSMVVKRMQLYVNRAGVSVGYLTASIIRDSSGTPSLDSNDALVSSIPVLISGLGTGNVIASLQFTRTVLAPGTYHIVLSTDATYKAGTMDLSWRGNSSTPPVAGNRYNGTIWSALSTPMNFDYRIEGRTLDLRVKITSSANAKAIEGFAALYDRDFGTNSGINNVDRRAFMSVADNLNEFTVNFLPDSKLLSVFHVETGQVYRFGSFTIQGYKVVFPVNTFYNSGINTLVTLEFNQNTGSVFDNSDDNANLLAGNHLGSADTSVDRSISGRGIFLRRPDGTLREICIDDSDNIVVYSI